MARGQKLSDAYVEIHPDDSHLRPEVKVKATRVGKEFGGALNRQLRNLKLDLIDIKASPKDALKAIGQTEVALKALASDAATVEVKVKTQRALTDLAAFKKRLGDVGDDFGEDLAKDAPKAVAQFGDALNDALRGLALDPIDIKASPADALAAIAETERKLRDLGANTATVEIKVKTEEALSDLASFRKKIGNVGQDSGSTFAESFGKRVNNLLASTPLSPGMLVAVSAAAAASAPLLGATIAGAIIGGVGIGGVVGGMVLVSKDARVKTAAKALGDDLQDRLYQAAGSFVAPALKGLKDIRAAANDIDVEGILRRSSAFIDPLVRGTTSAIGDLGKAVDKLIVVAGPSVNVIAAGIAGIGKALANGLSSLADNGDEAADALKTVFGIVTYSITTTFQLINALTELYGIMRKLGFDTGLQILLKLTGQAMDDTGESARRTGSGTFGMGEEFQKAADKAKDLKAKQEALKLANDAVALSQTALQRSLNSLGGEVTKASQLSNALKQAMDNLYGASVRNTDANEEYQASWDALSDSVDANKSTLDINTKAGRANRDALQALLQKNNDLYIANIAAGVSVEKATQKHKDRTEQVRKESERLGLNKDKTEDLIATYGRIPPKKATDLLTRGVDEIIIQLKRLYLAQRALAEGKTVNQVRYEGTAAMRSLATGGKVDGWSPSNTADNIPAMLTAREWVHPVDAVDYYGQKTMDDIQHKRIPREQIQGFARGGPVAPVETRTGMKFVVNAAMTKVMSMKDALAKVAPPIGNWPGSPSAQRGDSGVWKRILTMVKASGIPFSFGNAYRPGDPKWHGSGRAIDFMGYNQDRLAQFFMARKGQVLELIHRTNARDYGVTRGRDAPMPTQWPLHRNHLHIAMRKGGQVPNRLAGAQTADDGQAALSPGWNLVGNGTGKTEHMRAIGGSEARMHPEDIELLARAIGAVLAQALMGSVPATRVAARQAGRRGLR